MADIFSLLLKNHIAYLGTLVPTVVVILMAGADGLGGWRFHLYRAAPSGLSDRNQIAMVSSGPRRRAAVARGRVMSGPCWLDRRTEWG